MCTHVHMKRSGYLSTSTTRLGAHMHAPPDIDLSAGFAFVCVWAWGALPRWRWSCDHNPPELFVSQGHAPGQGTGPATRGPTPSSRRGLGCEVAELSHFSNCTGAYICVKEKDKRCVYL